MSGSVVSVLISDVGMSGTETCQLPWSAMESLVRGLVSYRGEFWCGVLVRRTGTAKWCGNLAASVSPMESARGNLATSTESHG